MYYSLADQYYLQALEEYPYGLPDVITALGYALSYDENHAGAHCLMGRLMMQKVKDYKLAAHHFEISLLNDPGHVDTYKYYSMLHVWMGQYDKAEALIRRGLTIRGMDTACLKYNRAILYETRGELDRAVILLRRLVEDAPHATAQEYLERELDRVERKRNMRKRAEQNVLMHEEG